MARVDDNDDDQHPGPPIIKAPIASSVGQARREGIASRVREQHSERKQTTDRN